MYSAVIVFLRLSTYTVICLFSDGSSVHIVTSSSDVATDKPVAEEG